jgi:hypothetical protein
MVAELDENSIARIYLITPSQLALGIDFGIAR